MTEDTLKKDIALREKSRLRENVEAILVAILLALFIRTFVVQAFKIPSGSMKDTLLIGDHILVNKFIYGVKLPYLQKVIIPFKHPQRGDIIVFKFPIEPEKDFIKRVVGVAGDVIEGHGGRRVFYPGLGTWNNEDFQDEWKDIDERGRLQLRGAVDPLTAGDQS